MVQPDPGAFQDLQAGRMDARELVVGKLAKKGAMKAE
jgi:hypothetical protein